MTLLWQSWRFIAADEIGCMWLIAYNGVCYCGTSRCSDAWFCKHVGVHLAVRAGGSFWPEQNCFSD